MTEKRTLLRNIETPGRLDISALLSRRFLTIEEVIFRENCSLVLEEIMKDFSIKNRFVCMWEKKYIMGLGASAWHQWHFYLKMLWAVSSIHTRNLRNHADIKPSDGDDYLQKNRDKYRTARAYAPFRYSPDEILNSIFPLLIKIFSWGI